MEDLKEEVLKIVKEITAEEISPICASWLRTFGQNEIPDLTMQFSRHYKSFISQLASSILETEARIKARVENLLNERKKLEKTLELTIVLPTGDDLPLYCFEKQLEEKVSACRELFDRRLGDIAALRAKEKDLCEVLDTEARPADPSKHLMSAEEIQHFKDHVETLQRLKQSRLDNIEKHRAMGKILLKKLGEGFAISSTVCNDEYLQPTLSNVEKLQNEVYELELICAERIKQLHDMIKHMNALYEELRVPKDQRLVVSPNSSVEAREKVAAEIERLEPLKMSKLPKIIEDLRSQIIDMSEKCCKSELFKHHSAAFHCSIYNETHQNRLQFALNDLKTFYELNEKIFKLIVERDELKAQFAEHNQKLSQAKDRLKNRGGQLLKDEKERKVLEKRLQNVEAALTKAAEAYEAVNKAPFLVHDAPIQVNLAPSPSRLSKGLKKQQSLTDLRLKKPFADRSNLK